MKIKFYGFSCKIALLLFSRTQLFREFKLCKLLLRALDDRYSARRGSSHLLRGYSRQTESYMSSLSNSADNSANDADFDDENMGWGDTYGFTRSSLYRYKRPGSNAYSLPARVGLGKWPGSNAYSLPARVGLGKWLGSNAHSLPAKVSLFKWQAVWL